MIEHKKSANGFEYLEVWNTGARARIALQGAHLFHYEQTGRKPLLWLSGKSFFEEGRAIRGGVPICWPWFGKHLTEPDLPQHGFARNFLWKFLEVDETDDCSTEVILQLKNSAQSLKLWPYQFELLLRVTVGRTLSIALITKNCDDTSFEITSALHSYFAVSDIGNVYVEGLDNVSYLDALTGRNRVQQGNVYIAEEVDRIYQDVQYPLVLHDRDRTLRVDAQGSASAVVWNPWVEKCAGLVDMQRDGYRSMLCIETANTLEDGQIIGPGEEHLLSLLFPDQS